MHSPDIKSFRVCSALNPDCSIRENFCNSSWLFAIWAFCFAEDTILSHQYLIAGLVIIINLRAVHACHVKIGLALPIIYYLIPVGYERDVKEHVTSKYCCTWRGFKDYVIGSVNGPCCIVKEDINVIGSY
jgi:hypothetical protein